MPADKPSTPTELLALARDRLTVIRGQSRVSDFANLRAAVWLLWDAVDLLDKSKK